MINRTTCSAALVAIALALPASAQYRDDGRWRDNSLGAQTAYDRGYRDGAKEGEKDARKGDAFEFDRDKKFERADSGYKKEFGDRERYRRVFRQGYATGYTDAYNGRSGRSVRGGFPYPDPRPRAVPRANRRMPGRFPAPAYPERYPGGYGSSRFEIARANGYRDGLEKGEEDWRKNRDFDLDRHSWFRSADRGYGDTRGLSKDEYRVAYREAFRVGYERAYRSAF